MATSSNRCFSENMINGRKAIVHVVIKATGKGHNSDKWIFNQKKRADIIEQFYLYSKLYAGITILSITCLSNHLHAQVHIDYDYKPSRSEVANAYFNIYHRQLHPNSSEVYKICQSASDLSKFMQRFCHDYAWKFNRSCPFKRNGHLWAEHFHSTLLMDSKSLLKCWLYVIFNPVKAGMIKNPLEYKFNSLTFENKRFCRSCLENLYEAYKELEPQENMTLDEFKEMLFRLLEEEVEKWKRLNEVQQTEYKEENHFWDKANFVGSAEEIGKIKEKRKYKKTFHTVRNSDQVWF